MASIGRILVLADQSIIAALVGMLVEATGHDPVFAEPGEANIRAVQRVRPLGVVLVDVELDDADSDIFFAAIARRGVGIAIFGSEGKMRRLAELAAKREVPWIVVPPTMDQLVAALSAATGVAQPPTVERRQRPEARAASADARVFRDAGGNHWIVYDRRGESDRRGSVSGDGDRVFVCHRGGSVTRAGNSAELAHATADDLERQLSQTTEGGYPRTEQTE